jgi:hypothetical protein
MNSITKRRVVSLSTDEFRLMSMYGLRNLIYFMRAELHPPPAMQMNVAKMNADELVGEAVRLRDSFANQDELLVGDSMRFPLFAPEATSQLPEPEAVGGKALDSDGPFVIGKILCDRFGCASEFGEAAFARIVAFSETWEATAVPLTSVEIFVDDADMPPHVRRLCVAGAPSASKNFTLQYAPNGSCGGAWHPSQFHPGDGNTWKSWTEWDGAPIMEYALDMQGEPGGGHGEVFEGPEVTV